MHLRVRTGLSILLCVSLVAPLPGGHALSEARGTQQRLLTVAAAAPPARVHVDEPPRVRPSLPPVNTLRPKVVPAVKAANPVHVAGPPMLQPGEIDVVLKAAARARSSALVHPASSASSAPAITRSTKSLANGAPGTGINPWWRYQEQNVPGGGHLMVNVGTGNLLLQDDDMSVPHKGIALAFRRTYNSQSRHDVNASDAAGWYWKPPGMYGNGWTNTFDAHLARNPDGSLWSVFDIDGARYDFTPASGVGVFSAVPGNHTTLTYDQHCGLMWTKKSGTTYYFYRPNPSADCPVFPANGGAAGGFAGRLYQIIGRNRKTYLTFSYSWDGGIATAAGKIGSIVVQTESGQSATLTFEDVNGHRLLTQLTYPGGVTPVSLWYGYDANGNLTWVSRPENNASGVRPIQTYGYQSIGSDSILQYAASPRYDAGCRAAGCGTDGGLLTFTFTGAGAATSNASTIWHYGVVNPPIADGSNTSTLQAGYATTGFWYLGEYYTTGPGTATFRDTDGHMTNWVTDDKGRLTQTQECTASTNQGQSCTGALLVTYESWDANNNLAYETDARLNQTDYVYDVDGNTVAVAAPPPTPGAARPIRLFSYDTHDNVTAYCDPNSVPSQNAAAAFPPAAPAPGPGGLCPQSGVATQYHWSPTADEPNGELDVMTSPATATTPSGYQRTISYDVGPQGGVDYGLPTRVLGAPVTQPGDPTTPTRQPQQTFWYDTNGNLLCYGTGSGYWILTYDSLNRLITASDPDDSATASGTCLKSGAQSGWNTTAHTDYFPDGSVKSKQSGSQFVNRVATTFTYDLDGNVTSETHHHGCTSTASCTAGVTTKWYDGADRLVEVQQPYDAADIQAYSWSTRYIYDLSAGNVTAYRGMGLRGYGNLVATQELLSGTVWSPAAGQSYGIATGTWTDVRATSFDALDRPVSSYEAAFGDQPKATNTYDGPGAAGLLSSVRLATNELKSITYDNLGRRTDVSYPNDLSGSVTPAVHEDYDAAGNVVRRKTAILGTETITYDETGAVTAVTEPATLGGGKIAYAYYADGMRSQVGYSDSIQSYAGALTYAYRADGKRERLTLGNGSGFTWAYTSAGRLQAQTDPLTGTTVHPDAEYQASLKDSGTRPYYPSAVTYAPWKQTYDSFGRPADTTLPVAFFSYTGSQYDLDDGIAALTVTGYTPPSPAVGNYTPLGPLPLIQATIRDEKNPGTPTARNAGVPGPVAARELNGTWLRTSGPRRTAAVDANWTLDARGGMLLRNTITTNGITEGSSYLYDASGRLVQDFEGAAETITVNSTGPNAHATYTQHWCPEIAVTAQNPSMICYTNGSRAKTYDAENRLRSETFDYRPSYGPNGTPLSTIPGGYAAYGSYWQDANDGRQPPNIQAVDYGSTSHPMRLTLYHPDDAGTQSLAWLWDGNDRFIECQLVNGGCRTPSLSMEGLGDYDLATGRLIRVNDRGRTGGVTMSRSASVFSAQAEAPTTSPRISYYAPCSSANANDVICLPQHDGNLTTDGWTLDYETWQGVRTSDLTIGQWNTPDAYAGEVHDPMSQKPFMWNRNNPYDYTDPSGYVPEWDRRWDSQWNSQHGFLDAHAVGLDSLQDHQVTSYLAKPRKRPKGPSKPWMRQLEEMIGLEETRPKPPAGSLPINKTEYTRWHEQIKRYVGNKPTDQTRVSPTGDVWVENQNGTWTNKGSVNEMFVPDKK